MPSLASPEHALDSLMVRSLPSLTTTLTIESARNGDNTKAEVVVAVTRIVPVTVGGTQVRSIVVPRTPTQHPEWHAPLSPPRPKRECAAKSCQISVCVNDFSRTRARGQMCQRLRSPRNRYDTKPTVAELSVGPVPVAAGGAEGASSGAPITAAYHPVFLLSAT